VARAARQMSFADLELLRQSARLEPLLRAICDFLDKQPALVERVRRDLVRGQSLADGIRHRSELALHSRWCGVDWKSA
jgi:hypothetical protein